jgi:AcrR family transcriptional regulator
VDTRGRILEAALDCFTESGYDQTTVSRIRERSGVSNGALFHHFPTKEAIADALYVDAIVSFQEGLWALIERKPRSLRAAVKAAIAHHIAWIEENVERARFVYARGTLDFDSRAGTELDVLNRKLARAYREWMEPLARGGQIRPMSMVVLTAVVAGPTHALARRWLAGQLSGPLHAHLEQLADAACAGLSGTPASSRRTPSAAPRRSRLRVELLSDDGGVVARGEATAELRSLDAA